jgi:membrane protein
MVIKGYRVGPLLKKTGREALNDNVLGLAAQTAYYFFLSLFPFVLFAAPILSLVGDQRRVVDWIMGQLSAAAPAEAIALVRGVVNDVVFSPNAPGIMSIGALLAAWAGSNVFSGLADALNQAYDATESRPWWKRKLIALCMVVLTGGIVAIAAVVMLAGPEIVKWLGTHLGLGEAVQLAWLMAQYPVALTFVAAALWLIYRFLPNVQQSGKQLMVGALVATVLWILVTLAFRVYVSNFGSYNKTYGTIGGVIILLTWMYLTMLVILVGGELNSELRRGTGALEPRRGAVYEGRVVTAPEPGYPSTERIVRV